MFRKKVKVSALSWSVYPMLLAVLLITGCGESPVSVVSNTPTPEPPTPTTMAVLPTATSIPVASPTELAQALSSPSTANALTYQSIVSTYQPLPAGKRLEYTESLKGKTISNWNGWVDVSRKQITTGEWELKLDMDSADPDDSSWDVRTIIPEAQASQFTRGKAITFSGTITEVVCNSRDCDVDIRNATFRSSSSGQVQPSAEVPIVSTLAPTAIADTPRPTDTAAPTLPPPPTDIPAPTLPPLPTDTLAPPTPTVAQIASGGLGLTRAAWESRHGQGSPGIVGQLYENESYEVVFTGDDSNGPIYWIWSYPNPPYTLEEARLFAKNLMPSDATRVSSGRRIPESERLTYVVDEYFSASLVELYKPIEWGSQTDPWRGGRPGSFYVKFKLYNDEQFNNEIPEFFLHIGKFEPQ